MSTTKSISWNYKKLSEVCDFKGGGTPSKQEPAYWNGNIPWASVKDIKSSTLEATQDKISKLGLNNSAASLAKPGDLILITRISPGKSTISKIEVAINQDLKIVTPKTKISSKFLHYFFQSIERQIQDLSSGTTVLGITLNSLNEIQFPDIPFEKQLSIVSKIEELFSELDKGVESLKLAQQQLKVYRQSVLNTLVTGKILKSIESVIDKLDQGWSPKCENEPSRDIKEWAVIKTSAVQHGYFLDLENKRLPKSLKPRVQHEIKEGDILITRAGPRIRVGVCCLVKHTRPKLINCDKVYRIKVNKEICLPEYLELILNTPYYLDEIEKMKSGINDSGLNLTQNRFLQIKIPLPSLKEQNKIVFNLDSSLSIADKMEESINQSLQQAEAIRQSILKMAFEGNLLK